MSNSSSIKLSTWIGSSALVLWIVEPLLVSEITGFPLFESLTLIFSSCFIITALRLTIMRQWHKIVCQPLFVWVFGTLAICGSDFCYILGAYCAPIAHVDLIDYLWPCFIVFFIGLLPDQKFSIKYLIGSLIGFFGVFQLIFYDGTSSTFNISYIFGYCVALFGVLIWGAYCTYSSYHKEKLPVSMIGVYCGIAALICIVLHLRFETTMIPTFSQGSMALLLGLAGPGLAYQLWDYGIKFGNARLLSVSCYFARIMSMALLVWFGKQEFSMSLVFACALAILGVFICSVNEQWLKDVILNRLWFRKVLFTQE